MDFNVSVKTSHDDCENVEIDAIVNVSVHEKINVGVEPLHGGEESTASVKFQIKKPMDSDI